MKNFLKEKRIEFSELYSLSSSEIHALHTSKDIVCHMNFLMGD